MTTEQLAKMSDVEKRWKIAELCGHFYCPCCLHEITPDCCHCGSSPDSHKWGGSAEHQFIPAGCVCGYAKEQPKGEGADYLNSLDAMAEAEEKLKEYSSEIRETYAGWVCRLNEEGNVFQSSRWACVSAKAKIKADAFLLTVG